MSEHIQFDTLAEYFFDETPLTEQQLAHLAVCERCRQELASLRALATSLELHVQSSPTPAQMSAYRALFAHVRKQTMAERVTSWVRATLLVDTRTAPVLGVRGTSAGTYRLLYGSQGADIDLRIVRADGKNRIEGALLTAEDANRPHTALVQLESGGSNVAEVEANADGRFHIDGVEAGAYRLRVTFASADDIVIEELLLV